MNHSGLLSVSDMAVKRDTTMRAVLRCIWLSVSLLGGCGTKPIAADGQGAAMNPLAFFEGEIHSRGVMEDRSGAPVQWVRTDSHGVRDADGRLRMTQHLTFQDGAAQDRDWTLWQAGPNRYEATANDMVGTASGQTDGGIFHWQWVLARHPGNPLMDVTMRQWMYQMDTGTVLIRTTISKLGVIVAEVTEQFSKRDG